MVGGAHGGIATKSAARAANLAVSFVGRGRGVHHRSAATESARHAVSIADVCRCWLRRVRAQSVGRAAGDITCRAIVTRTLRVSCVRSRSPRRSIGDVIADSGTLRRGIGDVGVRSRTLRREVVIVRECVYRLAMSMRTTTFTLCIQCPDDYGDNQQQRQ